MTATRRSLLAPLGLCAALLASASAQALEVDKAIEYRQDALRVMAFQTGPLGDMVQGNIDYDAEEFALRAGNLAALAHLPWEAFIEGSLQGDGHGIETRALAVIGDDWAGFEERQATFRREAATLAEMVDDQAEFSDLRRQMGAVVNSCRGCHDNYRAD
ncbi:c-type cytochrome [Halomonas alkalicola]|uniref:Cytochrome c n=1 Tax=Halomonas alkalicola TaxID=1930622 RepID=A0ABY9H4T8_9GAMM|nr:MULTISPECIES: cytochrome c [Halomonas]AXY41516.1 cytochrome c [Halomonas sp. JS92-SW72]WLI73484.1 cytochrome c [Halomonas alkalicola]